ncbi:MAG: flagellar FlbD family protein [Spirochaetota bacterium]|nr:flagellar FlbD family protein [Spirochaetota bacterium]
MIKLTRLNGSEFWINPHQIEFMEETPDTVIKLFSDKKVVVSEKAALVIERIIEYRRHLGYIGNDTTF